MLKSLIYLNEDLPSSIALRYAAEQAERTGMLLQALHVEEPEKVQAGTGWVRRTWEQGLVQAGEDAVHRLLKTEKVDCRFAGVPKVVAGEREYEILEELRHGMYSLYIEGYLSTSNTQEFHDHLKAPHLQGAPCPVMIVKNLVPADSILLLLSEGVDGDRLIADFCSLYAGALKNKSVELTVLYYRFMEIPELRFLETSAAGSILEGVEKSLEKGGCGEAEVLVVEGTPEQAALYVRDHGLVATSYPTRKSVRAELLALASNPVLLFKQGRGPEKE